MKLSDEWQEFHAGFAATKTENNARLVFQVGGSKTPVYLADIKLQTGGRTGAQTDESIIKGNVALFAESETTARTHDRMRFLAETEKAYFDDMRTFVRKDLNCGALVTGTIVFGPLGLWAQSDMDFIDAHAYWHHPHFPGRPWDMGNWTVNQTAMVDNPDRSPLFNLAASRLKGKPFTVSEYNHPAPNDAQAECVPMITAFAAAQDWDGIWLFAYSHKTDAWDKKHFTSFFDIHANPAKWGFVPAGTSIFREAGIEPAAGKITVGLGDIAKLIDTHLTHDRDMIGVSKLTQKDILKRRISVSFGDKSETSGPPAAKKSQPNLSWTYFGDSPKCGIFGANWPAASVKVASIFDALNNSGHPQVETITALDSLPLHQSNRVLITLGGRCENTAMQFSKDRHTVGRNWGKAPVRIENPILPIPLLGLGDGLKCYALKPDGTRGAEVPIGKLLNASPKYKTMWYLLVRPKK